MKKIIILVILFHIGYNAKSQCYNGNIETNTFTNWSAENGKNKSLFGVNWQNWYGSVTLPYSNIITIVTPSFDPIVTSMPTVYEGNYSIKLGTPQPGSPVEKLIYNFIIDNNNKNFNFYYALVMRNPDAHTNAQKPFFQYKIKVKINNNWITVCELKKKANKNDPYFKELNGYTVYRNWDCESCNLSNYIGKEAKIEFITAHCTTGGDYTYAYIDGLCLNAENLLNSDFALNKTEFCLGEDILMDIHNASVARDITITLEESDENFGRPNPNSEQIKRIVSFTNPLINIRTLFENNNSPFGNFKFKCNTYYRLKLALGNNCIPWKETVKLFKIKCPDLKPMLSECCPDNESGPLEIGTGPFPQNCSFSWTPSNLVLNPTSPVTLFNPSNTTTYPVVLTLTATDNSGCQTSQKLEICCGKPEINIIEINDGCCKASLSVNNKNMCSANEILWSNGSKEKTINVSQSGTYTVTVKNPCGVSTQSINVVLNGSTVPFANEVAIFPNANAIEPYSSNPLRRVIRIKHYDRPENEIPSYNATSYEFRIFNRWGEVIYEKEITKCRGFANGEIVWDGRDNAGNLVSADVFTWKLDLKNCDKPIIIKTAHPTWHCLEWRRPWWCVWNSCRECLSSEWHPNYEYNSTGSITVVY